jgi:hypothetical protein
MALGGLRQTQPTEPVGHDNIMVDVEWLTANGKPVEFAPTHPGSDALPNEVRFQLGDTADDGEEQPSHCPIRRDVLAPGNKLDAAVCEFVNHGQKVFYRTGHPVESGNDDYVEFPLPRILQHRVKAGATSFAAGDANVGVLASNFKPSLLGKFAEVVQLVVDALLRGTDSRVNRTSLHAKFLPMLLSRIFDGLMNGGIRSI